MTISDEVAFGVSRIRRLVWWSLGAGCSAALLIAATLEPDPTGYGTHTQLGLPPCGFLVLTGSPCPGCGLTTAFAHAIRGRFVDAASANAFGLILFAMVSVAIPVTFVAGWRRWSPDAVFERFAIGRWALAAAGSGIVLWVVRLTHAL